MSAVSLAIIEVEKDKIVMVSRKNNYNDFGIVGGKLDDNETPYEALVREVYEETGLMIKSAFVLDERNYDGYFATCYYVTELYMVKNISVQMMIDKFNAENIKNNNGEGIVVIDDFSKVMGESSSYADYNKDIYRQKESYLQNNSVVQAYYSETLYDFMDKLFPINWGGLKARIIETGVAFTNENEPWLIGVSDIQKTPRKGSTYIESIVKSTLFIAHDCFHNLWGLPYINEFNSESLSYFKRAQMSGEVAVLTITEFILAKQIKKRHPELKSIIDKRNATPMMEYGEILYHLAPRDLALRLDEVLHKGKYEEWIYKSNTGLAFFEDYMPMLQRDRKNIIDNWEIMKKNNFIPNALPNVRYSRNLTGAELTQWMIDDFMHLRSSDETIDQELATFNRQRRKRMNIPKEWVF